MCFFGPPYYRTFGTSLSPVELSVVSHFKKGSFLGLSFAALVFEMSGSQMRYLKDHGT